jgi:hypothetical protein
MEAAIGDLHAHIGLIVMVPFLIMVAVGLLVMRNEEAEDGEKEEVR